MDPNQIEIRNQQKDSWNAFSPGWQKWDDLTMDFLQLQGDEIINALNLRPGDHVLDVATGTGEPGLSIAQRVGEGSVIGVDLSEKMLQIAQEKAKEKNIANYSIIPADVCDLPFDDQTFDAISCRLGFMFFPNSDLAVKEMMRVLKPGGRIATTVWAGPADNIWITVLMDTIKKNVDLPSPQPGAPGMFRCAAPGYLSAIFQDNGLEGAKEADLIGYMNYDSPDQYWEFMNDVAAPVVAIFKSLNQEIKDKIKKQVYQVLEQETPGDSKKLHFAARLITVTKP